MPIPIFQNARFDALRNAIYHTERGRFLDLVNRSLNFIVIILGAAAVGRLAEQFEALKFADVWIQLGIVFVATIQLVFDFSGRSCTHVFLQKRYYDLLSEMETSRDVESATSQKRWSAKLLTIAGDEPITMRALDALAYNKALDATEHDIDIIKTYRLHVPWCQRRLRHVFAFQGTQFVPASVYQNRWIRLTAWFRSRFARGSHGQKSQG